MKRLLTLLLLLAGLTAAAQNSSKYEHFKELRDESDTLGMKQMLENWGKEDPEYYSAWANYCQVMGELTEDENWPVMATNWVKMGRDEFPDDTLLLYKMAEVYFNNGQMREALPVLEEIEEKGLGDVMTWFYLHSIYGLKEDLEKSRHYLNKMVEDGGEDERAYATEVLESYAEFDRLADSLTIYPDHDAIRAFAKTPAFQELTTRFEACDTTLTLQEIATLYYGSSYLKDYNDVQQECDDIRTLAEEEKFQEAKEALQEKLKKYPVSLFVLISLFNLTEDEEELMPYVWKARQILTVIDNTGRVYNPERPFQVICINDEYMALQQILRMKQFQSQALVETKDGPLDKMTFLNEYDLDQTVYFRITPPYWERLNSLFPDNE